MSDDQQEPVAWLYTHDVEHPTTNPYPLPALKRTGWTETPLYAHAAAPGGSLIDIRGKTVNEVERLMIEWALGAYPTREKQAEALGIGVRTLGLKLRNFHPKMLARRGRKARG